MGRIREAGRVFIIFREAEEQLRDCGVGDLLLDSEVGRNRIAAMRGARGL